MGQTAVVLGAGFGGLATACYLAEAGYTVEVIEKNSQPGGRASVFEKKGYHFDMGPSWYLMPDVYERFFRQFGHRPTDFYALTHLDPHYRVFYKDGDQIDASSDTDAMAAKFERYEAGAGEAFRRYLARSAETYETGMNHFVYTDRPRFRDYLSLEVVRNAKGLGLLGSMEDFVGDYFDHPKLQQLVQYSLVFLGGSPANTPALYHLMSHVDFNLGVHYPVGGMGAVVNAIVELGADLGVTYTYDWEAREIRGTRGEFAIESTTGERRKADVVISNADYAHTEQELLPSDSQQYSRSYWDNRTYAPSAYLLYLGVKGSIETLTHHNLVLPTDWDRHFEQIFDRPTWPDDPAYYVCAPTVTEPGLAPPGRHALFVLVPIAPGLDDAERHRERYRELVLADLARNTDVDLRGRIDVSKIFTVREFADRYNASNGTALGLAHTLTQTGPLRPDHRSPVVDGLYFTGAYTRPGIGVPMCLISGEHTANAVQADAPSNQ